MRAPKSLTPVILVSGALGMLSVLSFHLLVTREAPSSQNSGPAASVPSNPLQPGRTLSGALTPTAAQGASPDLEKIARGALPEKFKRLDSELVLVSAQTTHGLSEVVFRQTVAGVMVEPAGFAVVSWEENSPHPRPKLQAQFLDEIRTDSVSTKVSERELDAKFRVAAGLTQTVPGEEPANRRVLGPRDVFWITSIEPGGKVGHGRPARVYDVGGKQWVQDSESGDVLYSRDRRVF